MELLRRLDAMLADDDAERVRRFPGVVRPQPVHTVYVPADLVGAGLPQEWGQRALQAMDTYGPLPDCSGEVEERVRAKLVSEPIEDLRIDLEDGYGVRPDEDVHAKGAAQALLELDLAFCGFRIKSLEPATRARSLRSLEIVLDTLGDLPAGFRDHGAESDVGAPSRGDGAYL